MNHLREEQLVLFHYGEASDGQEVAGHLEICEPCRANYHALQRALSAVEGTPVPERNETYGAEVWRQLRPQLAEQLEPKGMHWQTALLVARIAALRFPRWALVSGLAVVVLSAFLAGRFWSRPASTTPSLIGNSTAPIPAQARERILLREIGDHLERSQVALIELINSKTNGLVDISLEQALARQLVNVNRLYRQTATRLGDTGMASVLEDLERTLIEISNS